MRAEDWLRLTWLPFCSGGNGTEVTGGSSVQVAVQQAKRSCTRPGLTSGTGQLTALPYGASDPQYRVPGLGVDGDEAAVAFHDCAPRYVEAKNQCPLPVSLVV